MAPPNHDGGNPFIIPSLIPPLASSSSSATGINNQENSRNQRANGTGTTSRVSSSLLSNHRRDAELSNANSKSLVSSSKRQIQSKEFKRRVLSPIENMPSTSNKNVDANKNAKASPFSKSPSYQSPLPRMPGKSSSVDKRNRSGQKIGTYSNTKRNANGSFPMSPSYESPLPRMPRVLSSTGKHTSSGQKIVFLFGGAIEKLFRINKQDSTEEICQLYESIVHGASADDPGQWFRVLELARTQHQNIKEHDDEANRFNKENLIRLYRLATLRFSLNCEELQASSPAPRGHKKRIFEIWLSYAKFHARVGNLEEARRTFKCIEENERILLDFSTSLGEEREGGTASLFYLAYSAFESIYGRDKSRAQKILLRGIKQKAEPILDLEKALTDLTCSDDGFDDITERYRIKGTPMSEKKSGVTSSRFEIKPSRSEAVPTSSQMKRDLLGANIPSNTPKRLKVSESESTPTPKFDHKLSTEREMVENEDSRRKATIDVAKQPMKGFRIYKDAPTAPTTALSRAKSQGKPPVKKSRPTLTSRLARKGLSGKAKRVDCSITVDDEDSSSDEETQHDDAKFNQKTEDLSSTNESKGSSNASHSKSEKSSNVPNFKKMDLNYMWAWDPNKKGKDQNETVNLNNQTEKSSDATNSTGSGQSTCNTHLTAIDTQGSGSSLSDSSVGKNITSSSTTKEGGQAGEKISQSSNLVKTSACEKKEDEKIAGVTKSKTLKVHRTKPEFGNSNSATQIDEATMAKRQALVAKANLEFLPLVHEDNILKVNNSTYAKLGVIGKGGSCKVYRALSKKCSVVAIKKVKLAGMDRKAIEGYANEISLLKRLRGNPAIIQMYDSEVDIQRKSIFLVMELGEVDLNNVLQQRALSKTSRSLNMNFIRLTWQQMLSAVHCIHEERIIHSDLKPANFLFVRGALKLIDFGIAKAIVNEDTTNIYRENHIGTLNYMSPEAILDTGSGQDGPRMKIGRASDVWSLGCILYEMVYGKTPFYKLHFIQKLQAIVNPGHKINFPEDDDAEAAIDAMKLCLCRNPEERPPIVGKDGLLNEHWFLHAKRRPR